MRKKPEECRERVQFDQEVICFTFCLESDFILILRASHVSTIVTKRSTGHWTAVGGVATRVNGRFDESKRPARACPGLSRGHLT